MAPGSYYNPMRLVECGVPADASAAQVTERLEKLVRELYELNVWKVATANPEALLLRRKVGALGARLTELVCEPGTLRAAQKALGTQDAEKRPTLPQSATRVEVLAYVLDLAQYADACLWVRSRSHMGPGLLRAARGYDFAIRQLNIIWPRLNGAK